ncbi:hypothetical protein B0J11DRAFT_577008 [Dendryphion nanum]|uniref:Uncharacterized protein n=1 Tax=Dendryphion nanum TaxID=256645 RepID=A0A9P9E7J5_9PLEO|nr:hypothetical protein B0J11DRAFT_577008 [Dendryphion nanum]
MISKIIPLAVLAAAHTVQSVTISGRHEKHDDVSISAPAASTKVLTSIVTVIVTATPTLPNAPFTFMLSEIKTETLYKTHYITVSNSAPSLAPASNSTGSMNAPLCPTPILPSTSATASPSTPKGNDTPSQTRPIPSQIPTPKPNNGTIPGILNPTKKPLLSPMPFWHWPAPRSSATPKPIFASTSIPLSLQPLPSDYTKTAGIIITPITNPSLIRRAEPTGLSSGSDKAQEDAQDVHIIPLNYRIHLRAEEESKAAGSSTPIFTKTIQIIETVTPPGTPTPPTKFFTPIPKSSSQAPPPPPSSNTNAEKDKPTPTSKASLTPKHPGSKEAPKSEPTPTQSAEPTGHTTVIGEGPHCPFPYPGEHCSKKPLTTFVTEKPFVTNTKTEEGKKPKETATGWCPYPGQKC